jgi:hypothetical protein
MPDGEMVKDKFSISVTDFMPEVGKIPINEKDSNSKNLFVGDIVQKNGDKYMIGYRYGIFILKPAISICYLSIQDYSKVTKLDEVWSTPDLLIVGLKTEPFYEKVKHL